MSLNATKSRLSTLSKDLVTRWAQTRGSWTDAKSHEFEQHYIDALQSSVNTALTNIDTLERIISRIRSDCE
jgi:hypothetical protein